MNLRIIALASTAVTTVAQAAPVDLSKSPCLQAPMQVNQLIGTPPLTFPAGINQTWDARGTVFAQDKMTGAGVLEAEGGNNSCILGATIVGPIGPHISWSSSIKPDGIQHARPNGVYRVHGAHITRVNDALSPPKATDIPRDITFSYRDIYARGIRDDLLENDSCLGGEISDSLFDGVHMGFSERPSRPLDLGQDMPVIRVSNTMMRLECQTDVRGGTGCPEQQSHGQFFKLSNGKCKTTDGRLGPRYEFNNVILRVDEPGTAGIEGISFPEPERFSAINVFLLYSGPGTPPPVPPGVTLVTDRDEVERIWNEGRARWIADHGCDSYGDDCRFLRRPAG